jgi:hypothetical protein
LLDAPDEIDVIDVRAAPVGEPIHLFIISGRKSSRNEEVTGRP